MTIILDLAPEDEAKLNKIAAQKGQNADTVAYDLFVTELAKFKADQPALGDAEPLPEIALSPKKEEEAMQVP